MGEKPDHLSGSEEVIISREPRHISVQVVGSHGARNTISGILAAIAFSREGGPWG